jgi:hypothetical protein
MAFVGSVGSSSVHPITPRACCLPLVVLTPCDIFYVCSSSSRDDCTPVQTAETERTKRRRGWGCGYQWCVWDGAPRRSRCEHGGKWESSNPHCAPPFTTLGTWAALVTDFGVIDGGYRCAEVEQTPLGSRCSLLYVFPSHPAFVSPPPPIPSHHHHHARLSSPPQGQGGAEASGGYAPMGGMGSARAEQPPTFDENGVQVMFTLTQVRV